MNKRGIFYSIMSLLIVGIMLISFRPQSEEATSDRLNVERTRIEVADNLIQNINEAFVGRILVVSSFRALNALSLYVESGDTLYPEELQEVFQRVMVTGNITVNSPIDEWIPREMMENHTLNDGLRMFENATFEGLSIIVVFNRSSIEASLFQNNNSGAENVIVNLSMNYQVFAGPAEWSINNSWSVQVPIEGLYDPLWINYENIEIPIKFADYEVDYDKNWTSLWKFINKVHYQKQSYGPSFLMRLVDDLGASSCCGIESAVNPYLLNFSEDYNRTYIDFCFYSSGRCSPYGINKTLYELKNITTYTPETKFYGFKLDARHYVETKAYAGNGTTGSTPTGIPSITMIQCEVNGTWQACGQAQWHMNLSATRARCQHTEGDANVKRVGFKLENEFDNRTFFSTFNSTRQAEGVWYYDSPNIFINDSDWWALSVECEDRHEELDSRVQKWFVPWGHFNVTWFYDENGTLKANVSCVGGECGELNITLG